MRKPKPTIGIVFILGLTLILLSVLGILQLTANRRFLLRGRTLGFPEPVGLDGVSSSDAPTPHTCVNVALEQYKPTENDNVTPKLPSNPKADSGPKLYSGLNKVQGFDLRWALDRIEAGGFTWVRQRFPWAKIEPERGEYRWEMWDKLVQEITQRDLRLIAVLDTAPAWAGMPPDPQMFATFASRFAARYGDRITVYQIWHNPNLSSAWGEQPADPYVYAELVARTATSIRATDPNTYLLLGSLAPTIEVGEQNYAEDLFLRRLYVAGAGPYFDAVAVQPYGFSTGPKDRQVNRDILNVSRVILVREVLETYDESHKAVWASHFGWNSKPDDWPGPPSIWGEVDEATQAVYTIGLLARAEQEWPWMSVMCVNGFQPRPEQAEPQSDHTFSPDAEEHWGFALIGPQGRPRPVYEALRTWSEQRTAVATTGAYAASTELATFTGTWTLGPQGADIGQTGDRVRLDFEGTGIALTVRRGPYRAFLFVTVDGKPAPLLPRDKEGRAYIVLYDPIDKKSPVRIPPAQSNAVATVPLAAGLPYGIHTVEVVAERGWDQWALADWRVANQPDTRAIDWGLAVFGMLGVTGLAITIALWRKLAWGAIAPTALIAPVTALRQTLASLGIHLRESVKVVLSFVLSAVYLFAAWQAMGQGVFRRLGEGQVPVLVLAAGLYYLSPWLLITLGAGVLVSLLVFLRPDLGLALTMFAAPLYMHPMSLLGKSFSLAELLLLPTLVGWGFYMSNQDRRSRRKSNNPPYRGERNVPLMGLLILFIIAALLSALLATHRREALRELRLVILEPILFYLALVTLPMEKRARWRIVDCFVLSAVMVAGVGLVQYFLLGDVITAEGGMRRLRSIYGSPNNVGLYLGRVLPLLIAVVLWGGGNSTQRGIKGVYDWLAGVLRSRRRWLYALAILPVSLALLLSFSRGALVIGIPAAFAAMGFLMGGRWRRLTLVVLILGALAFIPLMRTPRFAGMFDWRHGTTSFRLALWYSAWTMFWDHPLLGVGPDNFLYAYRSRYVLPTAWEEFNLSHPHNVGMDFATRLGVLGLMIFVWMQILFWWRALPLRHRDQTANPTTDNGHLPQSNIGQHTSIAPAASVASTALALGMMGSMVDFLAHGLVDASYFVIDLAFVYFLSFAVVAWISEAEI